MISLLKELSGGLVVIVIASLVGIGVNAARPSGVQLIQSVKPVATAKPHGASQSGAAIDSSDAALPEGAVSLAEMKRLFDEGLVVILDARAPSEYAKGHIAGAVNIPYDRLPEYMETLQLEAPVDARVICYCRGPECDFSDHLATELQLMGYSDVVVFTGGWEQWSEAGYPVAEVVE